MRIPGRKRAALGARWLRSRGVRRGLILGYHRIAETSWDPYGIVLAPQRFAEQLEVLRELAEPVPLAALDEEVPERAVVLTFDDGYADNLSVAAPLLRRYRVPATVFVATGYLGGRFWWDELAERLAPGRRLPERLELRVAGRDHHWSPVPRDPASRRRLVLELYERLREAPAAERDAAIERLPAAPARGADGEAPRALDAEELRRLADAGHEIGAHTRSHVSLGTIPAADQVREIEECRLELERRVGREVRSFSYPNGSVSSESRYILGRCGIRRACTSRPDVVTTRSDRLRLPRFWLPDWPQDVFRRWLRRWLGAARGTGVR